MTPLNVTATSLKNNTANVLNTVIYKKRSVNIKRHGKLVARIVPAEAVLREDLRKKLDSYYGAALDIELVKRSKSSRKISFNV